MDDGGAQTSLMDDGGRPPSWMMGVGFPHG